MKGKPIRTPRPPPNPDQQLTRIQEWYLECLIQWTKHRGRPPTIRELSSWIGKSESATFATLLRLEHHKLVTREKIAVPGPGRKMRFVPVGG